MKIKATQNARKWVKEILWFVAVPIVAIILVATTIVAVCSESTQQKEQTYRAWCKLNRREDISIEEWTILRANSLLHLHSIEVKRQLEAPEK